MMLSATVLFAALSTAAAECPNACSAHGKCGAYDMCTCYRNWMANDCSERVCQFGLAHVDTPKGDLDASSGQLTGPATTTITNSPVYPAGTSEQFPNMVDSDQAVLTNTAHYYMECSNKGICDRQSGECQCFDGYGGSACQRAECPDTGNGVCSGHGTCENIKTISAWDGGNIYKLWDEQATMGCVCDGGYQGANCEEKICKFGADPLYQDSFQTIRYANWTYSIYTMASATVTGNYSLVFTDSQGEDWQTDAIDIGAGCTTSGSTTGVIESLEGLPNNVIPAGSVLCQEWAADTVIHDSTNLVFEPVNTIQTTMHAKFTLAFPMNPGYHKELQINTNLDGSRTTLFTDEATSTLDWFIYSNGFYGENDDYVPDFCTGVTVNVNKAQISTADVYNFLDGLDTAELKLLKKCLGDADGSASNNIESDVENWDYGDASNPHLIKLVDATQNDKQYTDADPTHYIPDKVQRAHQCTGAEIDASGFSAAGSFCDRLNPPGFYAAIYWDNTNSIFRILGRPADDYGSTTNFHVYTTTGYLERVSADTQAFTTWNRPDWLTSQVGNLLTNKIYTKAQSGDSRDGVDCETWDGVAGTCLQKGDLMMALNTGMSWAASATTKTTQQHASSAIYPQIYTVKKISVEPIPYAEWATTMPASTYDWSTDHVTPTFVRHQIVTDKAFNFNAHLDTATASTDTSLSLFKFTPPSNKYNYAAPCSNRGICDTNTGLCQCFGGFTNDNCDTIDALAA